MTIRVAIQHATEASGVPSNQQIRIWAKAALVDFAKDSQLTIRIVDEQEGSELNRKWRNGKGPTNVLSFPLEDNMQPALGLLGDIVICAPVVTREASEQNKPLESHWAHMVIHGTLHLLGYDHIKQDEAEIMETLETRLLSGFGYTDPYHCQ